LIGVTMSDQQFAILIGVVIGAVWWLSREIRQATWNATPEAAKWREEAAKHTRFVEVKNKERAARRNKWAACLSRMKAAFPGWMFKETRSERAGLIMRLVGFVLICGFLYAIQQGWLG
jgi:hypothetical protein